VSLCSELPRIWVSHLDPANSVFVFRITKNMGKSSGPSKQCLCVQNYQEYG